MRRPGTEEVAEIPQRLGVERHQLVVAVLAQDVRATLREIRTPTLVLWGADDPLMPADCAEVFRREISGARRLLLRGAGHLPMLTRPEEFNRALLAFLGGAPVGD